MADGGRDVEQDIRDQPARGAKGYGKLIWSTQTTVDAALDGLVREAFGAAERLRDAAELLGEDDGRARALLTPRPGTGRPAVAGAAAAV
jgi:hypothetical protein